MDIAAALDRRRDAVSTYACNHGLPFGRRPLLAEPITLEALLELTDPAVALPPFRDRASDARAAMEERRSRREFEAEQRRRDHEAAIARHRAERAAAAEQRQRDQQAAKAEARHQREIARAEKPKPIREVEQRAPRQAPRRAPSREPAVPADKQPRAHPYRRTDDQLAGRRHAAAVMRAQSQRAAAMLDAGNTQPIDIGTKMAMRVIIEAREQEARLSDPIERAKTLLRRRFAPVCSMVVYDGDPDLFQVGHRKNVTRDELLAMAARARHDAAVARRSQSYRRRRSVTS
jgi:hypothetical protein